MPFASLSDLCEFHLNIPSKGTTPHLAYDDQCVFTTWCFFQLLGLIRAPGFNRLPMAGEEVVMSYMQLSDMSNQATDILYTISVAGTLVFAVNDVVSEDVITASDDALFEAVTDIAPTVFFGTVNVYERIYHCLREMKRSTSGFQRLVSYPLES